MKKRRSAFTLLEVLITLVIMAIATSLLLPGLVKSIEAQRFKATRSFLEQIWAAEKIYRFKYGHFILPSPNFAPPLDNDAIYDILKVENPGDHPSGEYFEYDFKDDLDDGGEDRKDHFTFYSKRNGGRFNNERLGYFVDETGVVDVDDDGIEPEDWFIR
ncbi:MAG: type II secretion system protein [Candidatus Omnitrophota bacterium]